MADQSNQRQCPQTPDVDQSAAGGGDRRADLGVAQIGVVATQDRVFQIALGDHGREHALAGVVRHQPSVPAVVPASGQQQGQPRPLHGCEP